MRSFQSNAPMVDEPFQTPSNFNNLERALVASPAAERPSEFRNWGIRTMKPRLASESPPSAAGTPQRPLRRRTVRVRLDPTRYALLASMATESDVTAEQLAGIWLRDRVDAAAGARSLALMAEPGTGRREAGILGDDAGSQGADATRTRSSLHTAIVDVLQDHGGPMTAAEIAETIRRQGAYQSPRSEQPITGATVSRRVANPYYRRLFERDGRKLNLARRARPDHP